MGSPAKVGICFAGAVAFTILALLCSARSLVITHSSQSPAAFSFPFAMFVMYIRPETGFTLWLALALPQFFVYACFCAWVWVCGDDLRRVCVRIFVVHMLLGVGCAALYSLES